MKNATISTICTISKKLKKGALLRYMLLWLFLLVFTFPGYSQQPAANLDQVRNGSADSFVSPGNWVNGNLGDQQSHYAEGMSIPYRVIMTDMPAGEEVILTLAYDAKHSGKHALDYLTHYDRIQPHEITFGHAQEEIDPTIGVAGISGSANDTYPIPPPPTLGSTVAGQPVDSYNLISGAGDAFMSIWNGDITNIDYGPAADGDLSLDKVEQQITVTFDVDESGTVILAWGGHIASRIDWGFSNGEPNSAGGINGSPYHMRLIDWNLSNLGNQDRSLSASAVIPPPECELAGPVTVCEGTTNTYTLTPLGATNPSFNWEIINNTAGASFAEPAPGTSSTSADVVTTGSGTYTIKVTISSEFGTNICTIITNVDQSPTPSLDTDAVCLGTASTFTATSGFDNYIFFTDVNGDDLLDGGDTVLQDGASNTYSAVQADGDVVNVQVSDGNDCIGYAEASAQVIPNPEIPEIETQQADCLGGDGSFIFLGDPQNLFVSIDGGSFNLYTGAISLPVGPHVFSIKFGEDGCINDDGEVEITRPQNVEFILNPTLTQPDCETGLGNVVFRIGNNADIDTGFFTYTISSGATVFFDEKQTLAGFDLPPGIYVIEGISDDGCATGRTEVSLEEPECQEFEGCTLGYWKNHTDRWTCYSTCTLYTEVFGDSAPDELQGLTLLEVLNLGGGGVYNLGRQSVAALLNTCHDDVFYEILTTDELIAYVQDNFDNAGAAGSYLDELNNAGCTLGGSRATTAPSEGCDAPADTKPGRGNGRNKNVATGNFNASPVPFNERLTIKYDFEYTSKKVEIQVYDLSGKLLRTYHDKKVTKGDTKELNIDFAMKSNQVYIIRVVTDREVLSKNVISSSRK